MDSFISFLGSYGPRWQPAARRKGSRLARLVYPGNWSGRAYYCDTFESAPFRYVGSFADIVSSRNGHTGYYCDNEYGDARGTQRGHVLQLTGRDHKPCYIPATDNTQSYGVTLYPLDQYDTAADAARAADGYAERVAESEREYDYAWQAGNRYADVMQEQADIRTDIIETVRDLRAMRTTAIEADADKPALRRLCAKLRAEVVHNRAKVAELWEKRHDIESEVPSSLMDAFRGGAGL